MLARSWGTYRRYFYTTWKGNPSSFLPPNSGWWATSPPTLMGDRSDPPPSKIVHVNRFPPVTSQQYELAKKVQLWRIGSRTRAFQRAIDEVRTLPLCLPKGGSISEFFLFWNKSQLQLNEVCYKVSLTENFQRQSCSTLIPLSNVT